MKFRKCGLIYCPNGEHEWEVHSFMTPTPVLIDNDTIRIWGGVRDKNGISRIKYIDVSAKKQKKILYVSDRLSLDIGNEGCFDDNGMILGDVVPVNDNFYMYYVGFQHVQKVKVFAFSGLAISSDQGKSFERIQETPILDRCNNARYGRCIHNVVYEDGIFKIYYTAINDWEIINGVPYPRYNIWCAESKDGIHLTESEPRLCIDVQGTEYRIGRPRVFHTDCGIGMYYTRDLITKEYLVGFARSKDGITWQRKDHEAELRKSGQGWDSEMACYAAPVTAGDKTYIFYSGNGMGKSGLGYAETIEE